MFPKKNWRDYYSETEKSMTSFGFVSSIFYHWIYIFTIIKHRPKRVLEVGCGRGLVTIFLSYFVSFCIGVDSEARMIQLARNQNKKFHGRAHFRTMGGKKTSFINDAFDIVCSQGLLEHYNDNEMVNFIDEWLRLAPICVISVPSTYYGRKDFGDERLLTIFDYLKILRQYRVSCYYYGILFHERRFSLVNLLRIYKVFNPRNYRSQILLIIKRNRV
jgi:SAM-dependent methyltransferase